MTQGWRIAVWVAIVVATLGFFWAVRGVLLPFALAALIAILLEPLVKALGKRGVPRPPAVLAITAVFFGLIGLAGVWAIPRLSAQANDVRLSVQALTTRLASDTANESPFVRWRPSVVAQPAGPLDAIDQFLAGQSGLLRQFGLPSDRRALQEQYVQPYRDNISQAARGAFNGIVGLLGALASSLLLLAFTPLFAILFMMSMEEFNGRWHQWFPPSIRPAAISFAGDVGDVLQGYLRGVTINITIYTVTMAIVLTVLGAPYSYLFAILAGLLYLIPNLGGLFSMTVLVLVAGFSGVQANWFADFGNSWVFALVLAVIFTVITTTWDLVVTPRVVGGAVKLHPLAGMFMVFCGGALFGVLGMILAYPVAGVIKVTLERLMAVTHRASGPTWAVPSVPLRHRDETAL